MDISDYFYNQDRDDIYHPFSDYNKNKHLPEESSQHVLREIYRWGYPNIFE